MEYRESTTGIHPTNTGDEISTHTYVMKNALIHPTKSVRRRIELFTP